MDICRISRRLTAEMAEEGYRKGMFPMSETGLGLVTWHRPHTRAILPLESFHISRSLRRTLRRGGFEVTFDRDFEGVMRACAQRDPTWISEEFVQVYGDLQRQGKAHSVEVWVGADLAGGVYGVHLGGAFFAESKFHSVTGMSKVALASLVERLRQRGFALLEVQYLTEHLAQFGVVEISHQEYLRRLERALAMERQF
ncbi:MAG: leucyl/phenylalanyl-tRNA--protein transferase [Candidatus Solibacter usitatus]|nr:leucyl/phenylalanyl-tRNA--protein transferase [Candidatus Solibacter usitatus]